MNGGDAGPSQGRPQAPADGGWHDTGHVCRRCGAQVQVRGVLFRCSTCFVACHADDNGRPTGICGCGLTIGNQRYCCVPNPDRAASPEMFVIMAATEDPPANAGRHRAEDRPGGPRADDDGGIRRHDP